MPRRVLGKHYELTLVEKQSIERPTPWGPGLPITVWYCVSKQVESWSWSAYDVVFTEDFLIVLVLSWAVIDHRESSLL
jgi:hypothetical protein